MTQPAESPKVLLVQFGARRQYAMPAAFEKAGMLEALYTDMCGTSGLGGILSKFADFGPDRLSRLVKRKPPAGVAEKTRTFSRWTWDMERAKRFSDPADRVRETLKAHQAAGRSMVKAGFGDATHVFTMLMEAQGVLTAAKDQGLTTLTDVNVALSSERIVRDERRKHPGWEDDDYYWGETLTDEDPNFRPSLETLEKTDIFLCPSRFVQSDLIDNFGISPERTRYLPYAANPRWFDVVPAPEPGRILFVGAGDLRKGIHTLADSAAILQGRGKAFDIRVAGSIRETVRARPEMAPLNLLGRLNYEELRDEYSRADMLVFPSLAEGSAGVTYEAMACGLPVITTEEAGSLVRDGQQGRIVEKGRADLFADAIEAVSEDRATRDAMAKAARHTAEQHSWDGFSQKLIAAVTESHA